MARADVLKDGGTTSRPSLDLDGVPADDSPEFFTTLSSDFAALIFDIAFINLLTA